MNPRAWALLAVTMLVTNACQPPPRPQPITASHLAALLRAKLEPCWKEPMSTPAFAGRSVALEINMAPDGTVENVTPTEPDRMATDPVLRALANAAMGAVLACSPLEMSPVAYEHWRNVVLIFRGEG
jgi:hypothetical protein